MVDHFSKGKLLIFHLSEVVSGGRPDSRLETFETFSVSTFIDRRESPDWLDPRERPAPRVREGCRDPVVCPALQETQDREDREV